MEQHFIKYTYAFFKTLVELHSFRKKRESNEGQSYVVEYSSSNFVIKIEKYFREFYVSVYKINKPDHEINLFNLLEYLTQGAEKTPKSDYFRNEKDVEECYKKQIDHISTVIHENYILINDFFSGDSYELRIEEFEKYWRNKHPEFYKKV
ncbi:hypothetical protein [Sphingobacterium sp. LRF_L2]|uniref:hypothetical protein n=1 Tax=Sphingobacterium sp. LRF_L2 TaxID=3369421 RepID=UPI003F62C36C